MTLFRLRPFPIHPRLYLTTAQWQNQPLAVALLCVGTRREETFMAPQNNQTNCPECGTAFPYRSNKRFCSSTCRKAESRKRQRKANPVNAKNSPSVRREQHEVFELAQRLAEKLYSLPPFERLGYIEHLVQLARSGDCPKLRKIMTNPNFIYPNPENKHLFWRGSSVYCTIAQAADRYCRFSPWQASVAEVVRGEVPEPPTGEILDELSEAA